MQSGRVKEALGHFQADLVLHQHALGTVDVEAEVRAQQWLAAAHEALGQFKEAAAAYARLLTLARSTGNRRQQAAAFCGTGRCTLLGRLPAAGKQATACAAAAAVGCWAGHGDVSHAFVNSGVPGRPLQLRVGAVAGALGKDSPRASDKYVTCIAAAAGAAPAAPRVLTLRRRRGGRHTTLGEAERALQRGLQLYMEAGDAAGAAQARADLGVLRLVSGDAAAAEAAFAADARDAQQREDWRAECRALANGASPRAPWPPALCVRARTHPRARRVQARARTWRRGG